MCEVAGSGIRPVGMNFTFIFTRNRSWRSPTGLLAIAVFSQRHYGKMSCSAIISQPEPHTLTTDTLIAPFSPPAAPSRLPGSSPFGTPSGDAQTRRISLSHIKSGDAYDG